MALYRLHHLHHLLLDVGWGGGPGPAWPTGVHVCAGYRVLRLQHDCMTTDDDRVSTSQGEGVHITG